jgi:hypothetical protein
MLQKHLALARSDRGAEADFACVGDGDEDYRVGRGEAERIERKIGRSDLFLFNSFDGADAMIGVNNFLADFETHHYTSCVAKNKAATRVSGWGSLEGISATAAAVRKI